MSRSESEGHWSRGREGERERGIEEKKCEQTNG
jgi:hypothetical protein